MAPAPASGFYGKLPCRGDFMQRRIPQEFLNAWDAWLQEGLHASRRQLGPQWLELYLTSPVWRFVLAEGVCGESAYVGVMLPSVDRVGRYFPLTLVSPLEVGTCLLEAACGAGRAWSDSAETLGRKALEADDLDLEDFDAEVEALAALLDVEEFERSNRLMEYIVHSGFAGSASAWHISMLGDTPQRAANALASIELQRTFRPCALWWTQGSEALDPGWLVTRGLPAPSSFAALLSGQWRESGWNSVEVGAHLRQPRAMEPQTDLEQILRPPEVCFAAAHPPLRHGPGASSEPRFVRRPEIGLWGVVITNGDSGARADLITDVAHDLAPQATLTAQVEVARQALHRTLGSSPGTAWGENAGVALAFLLAQGTEYAVLWSGAVRAVRVHRGTSTELLDTGPMTPPPDIPGGRTEPEVHEPAGGEDGGLLRLLAAPGRLQPSLHVRYDRFEGEGLWVLGAQDAIPQALIERLSAAWPSEANTPGGTRGLEEALAAVLAPDLAAEGLAEAKPLLLLAARVTAAEVS